MVPISELLNWIRAKLEGKERAGIVAKLTESNVTLLSSGELEVESNKNLE